MTTDTVKGRWSAGKLFSHYYSFVAGPGVVKVMFNGVPDSSSMIIAGELTDADGHLFKRTEDGLTQVNEVADGAGARLVSTYDIKRRQQLTVRFYTSITPPEAGGSYSIKVTGDGVAFNQGGAPTSNNTGSDNSGSTNTGSLPCLPKSGRLRIEMEDGSVQEINLSRVREAKIRP